MIVWALFDSGNGCYKQTVDEYFQGIEIHSIGIDIENKNDHFLHLDLADYSDLFGDSEMFKQLDKLPKPDIILASPPCESWSSMLNIKNGSFAWQMAQEVSCLFSNHILHTPFTIQTKENFYNAKENLNMWQGFTRKRQFEKQVKNRINGELTILNTIEIIDRYDPSVWVIENPAYGRIWEYLDKIHDFRGIKNLACYNDYDATFPQKPTIFLSNIELGLKATRTKSKAIISGRKNEGRKCISGYNKRSEIPSILIKEMLEMCLLEAKKENKNESDRFKFIND